MAGNGKGKTVRTVLDELPYGDGSLEYPKGKFGRAVNPEGVETKRLYKDVFSIAWPSFLELVLTQLTSMADQVMVGNLPGKLGVSALSAVGLSAQPKFLLMTMMMSLNVGSTAMVARFRGRGNQAKANIVFRQAVLLNIVLSVLMTILGIIFPRQLLRFMAGDGISPETFQYAVDYLVIQMYGFVPLCITFTTTAVLRGIGDTKTPLIYNTIANVVNLVFNYLLIYGKFGFPELDVIGASIATVTGQMVAFFIALYVALSRRRYVFFEFKGMFKIDFDILHDVIIIGIPSMIEQLFMRAGNIIFTRVVAGLGDTLYATHVVCMNIQAMAFMIGQAFANASTTLVGQSLGRRRYDMADLFTHATQRLGMIVSIVVGIGMVFFGDRIVYLYNQDPDIVRIGGHILILMGFIQPLTTSQFIISGGLRGAGDTRYTARVIMITVLFVRGALSILLVKVLGIGLWGAWIAMATDQVLRTLLIFMRYRSGKWKQIKLRNATA